MEERMKLEYRYLSERKAAEIDALGLEAPIQTMTIISFAKNLDKPLRIRYLIIISDLFL